MRRRIMVCVSGFAILTMAVMCTSWYAMRPVHRINQDTVEEIKEGMTVKEVEAIFGVPAGDYTTRPVLIFPLGAPPYRPWFYKNPAKSWDSNEASILIHFNDAGRVEDAFVCPVLNWDESWWDKIRRWLRLPP
jgi:hypothetical protein